ncbi:MAG TPA: zinc-dependent peptidase, partial [Ramlibacter sp.]|nr:zinc-dependent peptidase [Ramlibacter sp.]
MLGWWRKRREAPPLPEPLWQAVLARYPFLSQRPAPELARLRSMASSFLQTKEFQGAQGLVVTDEMALSIAAQA